MATPVAIRIIAIRNQSLAEARLPVGGATQEHFHPLAEEIYYITHGTGKIRIEGEMREVGPGTPSPFRPDSGTSSGIPAVKHCACCAAARPPQKTATPSSPKRELTCTSPRV